MMSTVFVFVFVFVCAAAGVEAGAMAEKFPLGQASSRSGLDTLREGSPLSGSKGITSYGNRN